MNIILRVQYVNVYWLEMRRGVELARISRIALQ